MQSATGQAGALLLPLLLLVVAAVAAAPAAAATAAEGAPEHGPEISLPGRHLLGAWQNSVVGAVTDRGLAPVRFTAFKRVSAGGGPRCGSGAGTRGAGCGALPCPAAHSRGIEPQAVTTIPVPLPP